MKIPILFKLFVTVHRLLNDYSYSIVSISFHPGSQFFFFCPEEMFIQVVDTSLAINTEVKKIMVPYSQDVHRACPIEESLQGSVNQCKNVLQFSPYSCSKYDQIRNSRAGCNDDLRSKARSVFDRYNIVNDQGLNLATKRHSAYLQAQFGHNCLDYS